MLFFVATLALLMGLLLVFLGCRRFVSRKDGNVAVSIRNVDLLSFQNLICAHDDLFLKASLPRKDYWTAKRARARAIQQYLRWIASDCRVMQILARSTSLRSIPDQQVRQELSKTALKVRVVSILFWIGLWVERILPGVSAMPISAFDRYGAFVKELQTNFAQLSLINV